MNAQSSHNDTRREDHDAFTSRAKAWAARLAAYMLDPLSSWLLGRGS